MAKKITDWDAWFWSKVDKTPNCWLWVGDRLKLGYGKVPQKHEPSWRSRYAHRVRRRRARMRLTVKITEAVNA